MIQKLEPVLCVQCHREMTNEYGNEKLSFSFCNYADCPNFALLQATEFPKEKDD